MVMFSVDLVRFLLHPAAFTVLLILADAVMMLTVMTMAALLTVSERSPFLPLRFPRLFRSNFHPGPVVTWIIGSTTTTSPQSGTFSPLLRPSARNRAPGWIGREKPSMPRFGDLSDAWTNT